MAGDNLSIVDFAFFETVEMIRHFDLDTFNRFENIKRFWTNFSELPAIKVRNLILTFYKAYLASPRF